MVQEVPGCCIVALFNAVSLSDIAPCAGVYILCDLNILFSIWSLWLAGQAGLYRDVQGWIFRGLAGQEAKPTAILGLFTHGVVWGWRFGRFGCSRSSAEGFQAGVTPARNREVETAILSPRLAVFGILAAVFIWFSGCTARVIARGLGLAWLLLFWASILVVMKFFGGQWVCVSVSEFRYVDSGYDSGSQPDAGIDVGRTSAGELAITWPAGVCRQHCPM